jgi:hypothetical protein
MLRPTVKPASLSWNKAPIWGLRPDIYYLCDSYGLVLVGRPLWREVVSVFCMCCWALPAQSFSGPSPLGLETIFYCLRFETSLFVASYDSQLIKSSGKLSCYNVSANRVEVTFFNSTVIVFLAVTVLWTVRCRGYRVSVTYTACIETLVTEVLQLTVLPRKCVYWAVA